MAVSADDLNQIRVNVLGTTVDAPGAAWTTAPPGSANTLNTTDRIINRAINSIELRLGGTTNTTNSFAARFDGVIGNEALADQSAFAAIGSNLIQAVATLVAGGVTGGRFVHDQTVAASEWPIEHDLDFRWVTVTVISPNAQTILVPEIEYDSDDRCILHFVTPKTGTAFIRR